MPELMRVKASMLFTNPHHNSDDVQGCLLRSLEMSRDQGSRGWELRTATDLAAVWASQGRSRDASKLLAPIFEQFTEGSDTADLKAAQHLLATLQ
jgi:predicted ATPase